MSGFKKVSMANVHLGVDQKVKIDLKLDLGQMTESVEIQAETPLLQTSSSDLATTVEEEQIKLLPLERPELREPHPHHPRGGARHPRLEHRRRGQPGLARFGVLLRQRPARRDNNYMLDGVDNNETWLQTVVIFPSVDALDEFKLQTSTYTAEFGRSHGRGGQPPDQVGRQPVPRQRVRVLPERRLRRQQLLQQPRGSGQARLQAEPVRGHPRRSDHQGQDVLLRRLPGLPRSPRARPASRPCPRT